MADHVNAMGHTRWDYTKWLLWLLFHWNPFKHRLDYALLDRVTAVVRWWGLVRYAGRSPATLRESNA